jgi:hypothetical protein
MIVTIIYVLFVLFAVLTGVAITQPKWPRVVVAILGMWTGTLMVPVVIQTVLLFH